MAERVYKRKRIKLDKEEDIAWVDVPVIERMDFLGTNAQLFKWKIANAQDDSTQRIVEEHTVRAAYLDQGVLKYDDKRKIAVERILRMPFLGTNAQVFKFKFYNLDPAPKTPDGMDDPHHEEKHYVRYFKENNSGSDYWVDVELIDRARVLGTNAQIYKFKISHPPKSAFNITDFDEHSIDPYSVMEDKLTLGFCDPQFERIDEDPPPDTAWRLDPWQNIVNISRFKHRPIVVGLTISWSARGAPDPYAFCNDSVAQCSFNHPEGWPPGNLDWCGPGQLNFTEETTWNSVYTEPFDGGPPNYEPRVVHTTTAPGKSGMDVGRLRNALAEVSAGGTLTATAVLTRLGGTICGQMEFPFVFTNVVVFPDTGETNDSYSANLPEKFTKKDYVFQDGKFYKTTQEFKKGALISYNIQISDIAGFGVDAAWQYDPGPIKLGQQF